MAVQTIGFDDKQFLNQNSDIADVNKVNDADMNEIKTVVNNNAQELTNIGSYSTTEVNTGKTWIDSKPIYRKVINCGNLPNNGTKNVDFNISNIDNIIFVFAMGHDTINNNYWNIPTISTSGTQYTIDIAITPTQVRIRTATDRSSWTAFVTMEYTKTTD